MGLILLEAFAALAVLGAIVWWTMFAGRRGGERRAAPAALPSPLQAPATPQRASAPPGSPQSGQRPGAEPGKPT